jgi:DNA-3-methyladenine glycosylase II
VGWVVIDRVRCPAPDQISAARARLASIDPALARADAALPALEWRMRPGGFAGLLQMIVEQQVSTAAAAAIWRRLAAGLGEVTPEAVSRTDEDALRALGLSLQKARYARGMAEAHLAGHPNFDALSDLPDEAAVAALMALKGVGRWTAELYLLFCEGRGDVFPAGDLALQEALRMAEAAPARLSEKALYARAEAWRPHRGVAAHLLWAYYSAVKRGQVTAGEV